MPSGKEEGSLHSLLDESDEEEDFGKEIEDRFAELCTRIEQQRRHEEERRTYEMFARTPQTPEQARVASERAKEAEDKRRREFSRLMKLGSSDPSAGPRATFPDGPIIALSLDAGGGNRTIIQLEMLDLLMKKIAAELGLHSTDPSVVLKPCEVFHLIVGTGTGGLIAILLGRLRMSIQEVMEFYRGFEEAVFKPLSQLDNVIDDHSAYKEAFVDQITKKITELVKVQALGSQMREDSNPPLAKVLLTAVAKEKDELPYQTFRSHTCQANVDYSADSEASIIDAVRETIPHSVFSKPRLVETGREGDIYRPPSYAFNPIKPAVLEVNSIFTHGERMGSQERVIVSIGSGVPDKGKNEGIATIHARYEGRLKDTEPGKMSLDQVLDRVSLLCSRAKHNMETSWLDRAVDRSIVKHFRLDCPVDRPLDPKDPDNIQLKDEANCAASAIIGARRQCILYKNPELRPPHE